MAINRTNIASVLPATEALKSWKVRSVSLTPKGYVRIWASRTTTVTQPDGTSVNAEAYLDVMLSPGDGGELPDVQQFDAVSVSGVKPRQAPGTAAPNTTYLWGKGVTAFGRHTGEKAADGTFAVTGLSIYATA